MTQQDRWELWNTRLRNLAIFALGLAGGYRELFLVEEVNYLRAGLILAFLGLPIAMGLDGVLLKRSETPAGANQKESKS